MSCHGFAVDVDFFVDVLLMRGCGLGQISTADITTRYLIKEGLKVLSFEMFIKDMKIGGNLNFNWYFPRKILSKYIFVYFEFHGSNNFMQIID